MNHLAVRVGVTVRKVAKRGHLLNKTLGVVVEVTDRLARVRTRDLTTTWPLALLEVVPTEGEKV